MKYQSSKFVIYGVNPVLISLFWIFGWRWPIWLIAVGIWMSFSMVVLATGITHLVKEPLGVVTVHISKVRSVPSLQEFLLSIAVMIVTFYALIDANFPITLLLYLIVCVVNLVTRALAWYSRMES